jgi:hypothetical protein
MNLNLIPAGDNPPTNVNVIAEHTRPAGLFAAFLL